MAKERSIGPARDNIKAAGKKIKCMAKVNSYGKMEDSMLGIIKRTSRVALENLRGLVGGAIEGNG